MKGYQLDCSKFCGYVEVDENNIIIDIMYVFNKFKGQPLENLTKWAEEKFGYCKLTELEELKVNTKLYSAFPGTGKTYCYNNSNKIVLDSDSSKFDKKDFPNNYIKHIKKNLGKAEIIFISSHKEVREALVLNNLDFTLIYPQKQSKADYILRYINRGNPKPFISLVKNNWDLWIDELKNQKGCNHIVLKKGQYISDII